MKCPHCGRRVTFNNRSNWCARCGGWLLKRPPSEHELQHQRKGSGRDDFLNDFPWIGGAPGKRAVAFTVGWVTLLVVLAMATLLAFITLHIVAGVILIILTVITGTAPTFFLIGSRI